jgi:DNA-binding CsgD family transcriptional regulator
MLFPGTQMHIVTFIFVSIEIVIFFYLLIYRLARPDDKTAYLNIILIFLLIVYNITGGLFPDPNMPGSFYLQESIAYGTGFITPCYFPYYVYKAFGLEKMKFQAYRGIYFFLIIPYIAFVVIMISTKSLDAAKNLLIVPVVYAVWVVYSLFKAVRYKYNNQITSAESKEELLVMFLSISTWLGLPIIDYWNIGQAVEVTTTNFGFLLLFSLQVKRHIKEMRLEHQRLIESEKRLLLLNNDLQKEVSTVTKEFERIIKQQANTFVGLSQEIEGPLATLNETFDKYSDFVHNNKSLVVAKSNIDKLNDDIADLVKLNKVFKGLSDYNQGLVSNFGKVIKDSLILINTSMQVVGQFEGKNLSSAKQNFDANCKRYNLTRREIEIAKMIEQGKTNADIAAKLFISEKTVAKHKENLFSKVDVSNRIELINKLNS